MSVAIDGPVGLGDGVGGGWVGGRVGVGAGVAGRVASGVGEGPVVPGPGVDNPAVPIGEVEGVGPQAAAKLAARSTAKSRFIDAGTCRLPSSCRRDCTKSRSFGCKTGARRTALPRQRRRPSRRLT